MNRQLGLDIQVTDERVQLCYFSRTGQTYERDIVLPDTSAHEREQYMLGPEFVRRMIAADKRAKRVLKTSAGNASAGA